MFVVDEFTRNKLTNGEFSNVLFQQKGVSREYICYYKYDYLLTIN